MSEPFPQSEVLCAAAMQPPTAAQMAFLYMQACAMTNLESPQPAESPSYRGRLPGAKKGFCEQWKQRD
jgi:hypothetical protein